MSEEQKTITWTVNDQQAAYILTLLAERPHKEVEALIGEMRRQVAVQRKPSQEVEQAETTTP